MSNQVAPIVPELEKMKDQFLAALPEHITVDRFTRICMTAINGNPDLIKADRRSLLKACMEAAQDGLRPDGREGALVIFNTKAKDLDTGQDKWISAVKWMPMVAGIIKKARNSGEIAGLVGRVVYAGDKYRYWIDSTGEHLEYEPCDEPDLNNIRKVFALAILKDGTCMAEPMSPADVEKVRAVSKAKNAGPWTQWWDQMAIKTAIRRLSKRLPASPELEQVIQRDDDLHEFDNTRRASFSTIENPLRDTGVQIEHDADGVVEDEKEEGASQEIQHEGADREVAGDPSRLRGVTKLENAARLVILESGEVKKYNGSLEGPTVLILDHRFEEPRFDEVDEWQMACREIGVAYEFDGVGNLIEIEKPSNRVAKNDTAANDAGTGAEGGSEAGAAKHQGGPAGEQTASVKAPAASSKAPVKPYTDAASYMAHMRGLFTTAKAEAAITDIWGSTRADRNELLDNPQIDELTKEKSTAVKRLRAAKGDV